MYINNSSKIEIKKGTMYVDGAEVKKIKSPKMIDEVLESYAYGWIITKWGGWHNFYKPRDFDVVL